MEAVSRRRKTARERRDQCLRAEARRLRRAQGMGAAMVHRGDKYQGDPFWYLVRGSMFSSNRLLSLESFLLMLWFLCKRPLIAALLA